MALKIWISTTTFKLSNTINLHCYFWPPLDFSFQFSISLFGSSINKYFPEANVESLGSLLFNIVPHDPGQNFTLRKTQELFSRLPWTHIFWINFS